LAYVYVDDVDEVLDRVTTDGGRVVKPPYAEGDLRVATFRDPSGTVIGVWQQARIPDAGSVPGPRPLPQLKSCLQPQQQNLTVPVHHEQAAGRRPTAITFGVVHVLHRQNGGSG
jgi:hypothetical protein